MAISYQSVITSFILAFNFKVTRSLQNTFLVLQLTWYILKYRLCHFKTKFSVFGFYFTTNRLWAQSSHVVFLIKMETPELKDIGHLTRFNGTNFNRWKCGIRLILEQHGLTDIIDGVERRPEEVNLCNNPIAS